MNKSGGVLFLLTVAAAACLLLVPMAAVVVSAQSRAATFVMNKGVKSGAAAGTVYRHRPLCQTMCLLDDTCVGINWDTSKLECQLATSTTTTADTDFQFLEKTK